METNRTEKWKRRMNEKKEEKNCNFFECEPTITPHMWIIAQSKTFCIVWMLRFSHGHSWAVCYRKRKWKIVKTEWTGKYIFTDNEVHFLNRMNIGKKACKFSSISAPWMALVQILIYVEFSANGKPLFIRNLNTKFKIFFSLQIYWRNYHKNSIFFLQFKEFCIKHIHSIDTDLNVLLFIIIIS